MTTIERIVQAPVKNWTDEVSSLSRGDNIEEGHFMERTWPALFATAKPHEEQGQLKQLVERIVHHQGFGYH